jgi:hypothetical protein
LTSVGWFEAASCTFKSPYAGWLESTHRKSGAARHGWTRAGGVAQARRHPCGAAFVSSACFMR